MSWILVHRRRWVRADCQCSERHEPISPWHEPISPWHEPISPWWCRWIAWRWTTWWIWGKWWTWVYRCWNGESGVKKCRQSRMRFGSFGLRSGFFFFFFFFPCCGQWLKEEVGIGLIWMVAEFYLCSFFLSLWVWLNWQWREKKKKKSRLFSSCRRVLVGSCSGFGLVGGGWEREKQRDGEHRWIEKREREIFYIILLCNLYYFNI